MAPSTQLRIPALETEFVDVPASLCVLLLRLLRGR